MKKILSLPRLLDVLGFAVLLFLGFHCYKMAAQQRYFAALLDLYWLIALTVLIPFFLRKLYRA